MGARQGIDVVTPEPSRPTDRTGAQVQPQRGVKVIVRSRTVGCVRVAGLTGKHAGRRSVVVAGTDIDQASARINDGRLPDGSSAVLVGGAKVIRHIVGLP